MPWKECHVGSSSHASATLQGVRDVLRLGAEREQKRAKVGPLKLRNRQPPFWQSAINSSSNALPTNVGSGAGQYGAHVRTQGLGFSTLKQGL